MKGQERGAFGVNGRACGLKKSLGGIERAFGCLPIPGIRLSISSIVGRRRRRLRWRSLFPGWPFRPVNFTPGLPVMGK